MAAATAYLLLPYTAFFVGQLHHVWPMALVVWAAAAYRKPGLSGTLLGLAAGSSYFPVLIFPAWLSFYRGRGAGRFVTAFVLSAGVSLAVLGAILWREGNLGSSLGAALTMADWQAWKVPTSEGFWLGVDGTGMHWAFRFPVFLAFMVFVVLTAFWPAPKNLAHVLALSAAVFIGVQFWYADQGGVYVLWYLPLLLLVVFRPNLSDRLPPIPASRSSRLLSLGRLLGRWVHRVLKPPEPAVKVH
jgi:hypothetical protein